jgi:hypothetical protein
MTASMGRAIQDRGQEADRCARGDNAIKKAVSVIFPVASSRRTLVPSLQHVWDRPRQ